MKRILCLIIIIVFCAFNVFAVLSGEAQATQKFDFYNRTIDYDVQALVKGSLIVNLFDGIQDIGSKTGQKFPYSEFEVTAEIESVSPDFYFAGSSKTFDAIGDIIEDSEIGEGIYIGFGDENHKNKYPIIDAEHGIESLSAIPIEIVFTINKFRSVGGNWVLDLINVPDVPNYAKSSSVFGSEFVDFNRDDDGNEINVPFWYDLNYDYLKTNERGFSFTHEDYGTIGLAVSNLDTNKQKRGLSLYAIAETKSLNFFDNLQFKLGTVVGKRYNSRNYGVGISAHVDYENDFIFSIDSDVSYNDRAWNGEASGELYLGNTSTEVYYASEAPAWYFDKYILENKKTYGYGGSFDAKQFFGIHTTVSLVNVLPKLDPVLTITGKDMLHFDRNEIGFNLILSCRPYLKYFKFGIDDIFHDLTSVTFSAATDFTEYMELPFSSLVLACDNGISLDAEDIFEGFDFGIYFDRFYDSSISNLCLRGAYSYKNLTLKNVLTYCFSKKHFSEEFNIDLALSDKLTLAGRFGYGATKNADDDYEYKDNILGRAGVDYSLNKFSISAGGQLIYDMSNSAFEYGAYFEAEGNIIDGATLKVQYNPREDDGTVNKLSANNVGVLTVSYEIEY